LYPIFSPDLLYKTQEILMVIRSLLCFASLLVCLTAVGSSNATAGELTCRILQFQHNRFYFNVGEDKNIFRGNRFVVYYGADSLLSGLIDQSFLGISYSEPLRVSPAQPDFDSLTVTMETADIDSTSTILLGSLNIDPVSLLTGDSVPVHRTDAGNPIDIAIWRDSYQVIDHFEYGQSDGVFSLSRLPWINTKVQSYSTPAPFIAAIVPNLSSQLNRDGYLTTSLYYRFGPSSLGHLFDGEQPELFNSFYLDDSTAVRAYPYDRARGRQLLETMGRPTTIRVSYLNRCLEPLADYFADILSRDKVHIEIEYGNPDADVLLELLPFRGNESVATLTYLRDQLKQMKSPSKAQAEALAILSNYVDAARDTDSLRTRRYYSDLADRSFKRDLGVYPLFRPKLFFISRDRLRDFSFAPNGLPRLDNIDIVDLPVRPGGTR